MHLKNGVNFSDFLRSVKECEGDILFMTEEGDVLNLKSELSKYVFAMIAQNPALIAHATITCKVSGDQKRIQAFLT